MQKIISLFDRDVFYLEETHPAVFYINDREGGGILINTPAWNPELLEAIRSVAPLNYIFYPSRFGAQDITSWKAASGAQTMAYGQEADAIPAIDKILQREHRFSRTIDFLPMSGRTKGSCALRCKNKPGIIFFGPILDCALGSPTLVQHADDDSFENRLFGALALQDLKFDYALTDDFRLGECYYGPGADAAIRAAIDGVIATI